MAVPVGRDRGWAAHLFRSAELEVPALLRGDGVHADVHFESVGGGDYVCERRWGGGGGECRASDGARVHAVEFHCECCVFRNEFKSIKSLTILRACYLMILKR